MHEFDEVHFAFRGSLGTAMVRPQYRCRGDLEGFVERQPKKPQLKYTMPIWKNKHLFGSRHGKLAFWSELQCCFWNFFTCKTNIRETIVNLYQLSSTPLLLLTSKSPNIDAKLCRTPSCLPWSTSTARAWWTNWISAWRFWAAGVSRRIDLSDYMMLVDDD